MTGIRLPTPPLSTALLLVVTIVAADLLWIARSQSWTRENGGLETATALLYLYAAGCWLRLNPRPVWRRHWHVPLVLALMAGREFDLDVALTSQGLLTSALYFTDRAPVWERLFGAAVVAVLAVILYRLIAFSSRDFVRALKRNALWAQAVLGGIAIAILAISIDGLERKLRPLGVTLPEQAGAFVGAFEEVVEILIPLLFLVAISAAADRRGSPAHP